MIRPLDAITLARTKIRSKRVRLLITTIVSALVFGVMAASTVLLDGISTSIAALARENLRGQYLVAGSPNPMAQPQFSVAPNDPTLIAEVQALHATYIAERKAAAKRLAITEYDERTEDPPVVDDPNPNVPAEFKRTVNMSSVAYQRWIAAKEAANPGTATDATAFQTLVGPLGATKIYVPRNLTHLQLRLLVDGKEDLTTAQASQEAPEALQQTAIASGNFTMVPDQLVETFVLPPNAARAKPAGVPVLITAEDAVALFGTAMDLPKRPVDPAAQLTWFTQTREKVNGATFVSCHRNNAEQSRVEQARVQANEVEANKTNRDYIKPSLLLALPTSPCGMVTVARDVRTAQEKKEEANRATFEAEFKPQEEPLAELVTFQVVGFLPSPSPNLSGIDQVLASVVGTSFGFGAVIPEDSWRALAPEVRHEALLTKAAPKDPAGMSWSGAPAHIASFPTVDKARAAVQANSCQMSWTPACESAPFHLATYGSNYLAVDDLLTQARPLILALLALSFGIATIILWAMMGRVIADSRRETAVFRAIGAKRSDIIAVYLTYSLWVAVRIVVFAALIGAAIAAGVEFLYAGRATTLAHLTYGIFTPTPRVTFIGLRNPVLWGILGGIVAMALIAITPPLLRNIRRNPIRDMRDD